MENKTSILFPIEIVNRELDYKLFLACMCARTGGRIYVGQHDTIYRLARHMRSGIYIGKNIFRKEWPFATLDRYNRIKKNGFIFIHLDEEGAVYNGLEEQWKAWLDRRLDPRCLAKEDSICTWGDFQRDYYRSLNPACKDNIVTAGYPKLDLYKDPFNRYYEDKTENIKRRYGDFILFNTNFTYANFGLGVPGIFSPMMGYIAEDKEKSAKYIKNWVHDNKIYLDFIRLINMLSVKFSDINIVIRPHPCENHDTYRAIFRNVKNVHVVHEDSVIPWLQACRVLIHNGCTTAIEAYFLHTKVINYKPIEETEANLFLPNLIGAIASSETEVVSKIESVFSGQPGVCDFSLDPAAGELIYNFRSDDGLPEFLKIISKAQDALPSGKPRYNRMMHGFDESACRAYNSVKNAIRPLFKEKERNYRFFVNPGMFYGFDKKDVLDRVRRIQEILGVDVSCKFYNNELFFIESAKR
jgi:surface carbohydrate biosynthesis protein